jgi:hypothetical protein
MVNAKQLIIYYVQKYDAFILWKKILIYEIQFKKI